MHESPQAFRTDVERPGRPWWLTGCAGGCKTICVASCRVNGGLVNGARHVDGPSFASPVPAGAPSRRNGSPVAAATIPTDEGERQVPPEHHRGGRRPGRREPDDGLPCVVRQSPGRRHHEPTRPRGDRRAWLSTEQPRPKSSPPTLPDDRPHRPRHHEPVLPGARTRRRRRAGRALPDVRVQHRRATRAGAALRGRGERPTGRRGDHRGVRVHGRRCSRRSLGAGVPVVGLGQHLRGHASMPSSPRRARRSRGNPPPHRARPSTDRAHVRSRGRRRPAHDRTPPGVDRGWA